MYCTPSTANELGTPVTPELVLNCQSCAPVLASNAQKLRSLVPPRNTRPPPVVRIGPQFWTHKFPFQNWGPILTTGGGLVFLGGTNDRNFWAFDAKTGAQLWQFKTNSGVTGVPSSFAVDGVQYIAVQSGWGVDAQRMQARLDTFLGTKTDVPQGGVLWVFALRD